MVDAMESETSGRLVANARAVETFSAMPRLRTDLVSRLYALNGGAPCPITI